MAYYRKRCKCGKEKWNKCPHPWGFTMDGNPDPVTGKRKQIPGSGFATKKDAINEVARITMELSKGKPGVESNDTLADFSKEWLQIYRQTSEAKYSTYVARKRSVTRLLKFFPKNIKLKDVSVRDYENAVIAMKKKYKHNTILGTHNVAHMLFEKAKEYKMIDENPTDYIKIIDKKPTLEEIESGIALPKYLEKDELALLLKTAKEQGLDQNFIMILTLAYTGLRVGELCALKWKNIDFKEKIISVTKTYTTKEKKNDDEKGGYGLKDYMLTAPKNKKSVRDLVVDDIVLAELEKHLAEQRKFKMSVRNNYHDPGALTGTPNINGNEDFVFIYTNEEYAGYPIKPVKVDVHMHRLLVLAQLNPTLTPHSLRHTHTSLLAEAGVSLEEIMERLGHSNDSTTRNVYLHVTKTKKKEAARKFGELMKTTLV